MRIRIGKINEAAFTVRENIDVEALEELKQSLQEDGQWDPILVRPVGEEYELIAGHRRVQAAKELGWTEIDATIKQLDDTEALFLALKTNLVREGMSEREQGKVLHEITEKFDISNVELAKKLSKSEKWVRSRVRLALDLSDKVANALETNKITMSVAEIIGSLEPRLQDEFLIYICKNNIERNEAEVRKAKKYFLNTTIYTIGYEGKEIKDFIEILKKNNIEMLLDVRFSTESPYKPEFNKNILSRELEREKIKYIHNKDLGVPFEWQNPYKDGGIPFECFDKYYRWHTTKEVDFASVVDNIKLSGKTALMCFEKYAIAQRDQIINCHRSILAARLKETGQFKEVIHL